MVGFVLHRDRRACMVRFFSAAGVELEEMERLMTERPELKNKIYVYRDGETNNNEGGNTNK